MAEVWIVDVTARVVEVAVEPTGDGYEDVHQLGVDATVSPGAFPDVFIAVAALLARARRSRPQNRQVCFGASGGFRGGGP